MDEVENQLEVLKAKTYTKDETDQKIADEIAKITDYDDSYF